ncbi:hypothetical protein FQR65_LT17177 [Abscondita terminalis]|nr:hypothetical protein FQR65_LT17177 [Abscondita terminalis]
MGPKTIIAGLLHDVIEDTPVTFSDIEDKYGLDVANLVEAVTKVSFFTKENREQMKASYLRKLFVSMVKDIRVIVIKIADRMHNLLTLEHMTVEKQNKIAQETLDIYSSIAHRLGMKVAKNILEDYSFKILNLEEYNRIERLVEEDLAVRSTYINEIIEDLESKLKYEYFFNNVAVMGRQKTIYSIYRKMNSFNKNFSDINDILAVRILCESVDDCYRILGYVHQNYSQLNGRFKDYISTPKNNLYQSIHTTVVSKKEVGESDPTKIQLELDNKIDMFNKLINIDKMGDNEDDEKNDNLMEETFKSDYLTPTIYLLTQNSSIITLPLGSTVIDFAYKMSTEIGHTTIGAKINGVFSPINTTLNSGEIVEIKTSADSRPEPCQQESCLKIENEEKIIKNASKEIERYISSQNLKDDVYSDIKKVEQKVKELDFVDLNSFLLAVGEGVFTIAEAVNLAYLIKENDLSQTELNDIKTRKYRNEKGRNDILINNMEKISCKLSECCYPIPFENIIATISNEAEIIIKELMIRFNYDEIKTPIFESIELFKRGVGEDTDVVSKEMFIFEDKKNRTFALRPEGTAPTVRAVIENTLYTEKDLPLKLFYIGPMFRYERPQAGRQRQFTQFGVEVLGMDNAYIDSEVISIGSRLLSEIKIDKTVCHINYLVNGEQKEKYINDLIKYLSTKKLCEDCKKRVQNNPLRTLDCKIDSKQFNDVIDMKNYLSETDKKNYQIILNQLKQFDIKYVEDKMLVRGLDYYTGYVFEIKSLEGVTLLGGGRYNNLVKDLDGPNLPSTGFAMGIERILIELENKNINLSENKSIDCYVIPMKEEFKTFANFLTYVLRTAGFSCDIFSQDGNLRSAFRKSEKYNPKDIVIIGEEEYKNKKVSIKNQESGQTIQIDFDKIVDYFNEERK